MGLTKKKDAAAGEPGIGTRAPKNGLPAEPAGRRGGERATGNGARPHRNRAAHRPARSGSAGADRWSGSKSRPEEPRRGRRARARPARRRRDELEYEVLDEPRAGLFGRRSGNAHPRPVKPLSGRSRTTAAGAGAAAAADRAEAPSRDARANPRRAVGARRGRARVERTDGGRRRRPGRRRAVVGAAEPARRGRRTSDGRQRAK